MWISPYQEIYKKVEELEQRNKAEHDRILQILEPLLDENQFRHMLMKKFTVWSKTLLVAVAILTPIISAIKYLLSIYHT